MSLFCSPYSDHCDRLQIQDFAGCGSLAVEEISHTFPNSHRLGTRLARRCFVSYSSSFHRLG